ncbi:MAG: DNA/RNA non-specific endonuclease [Agathobacter sp.]|nr:DNA/RNA non-specific endonuclease [Agathobacter sp.]
MKKLRLSLILLLTVANLLAGCSNTDLQTSDNVIETGSNEDIVASSTDALEDSSKENTETETGTENNNKTDKKSAKNTSQLESDTSSDKSKKVISDYDKGIKNLIKNLPTYEGYANILINDNKPFFTDKEKKSKTSFEHYSDLDSYNRCGVAYANISRELQPTEKRGEIGHIKPSGWHTVKYPDIISDRYLYNRCHIIGFQLAGENDNEKNLITGTRYMNITGQLPLENEVDDLLEEKDYHVLYRVTPIFIDDELVCRGVLTEAYSVEDAGKSISFCVYSFNVQPGISIDYKTGDSTENPDIVAKDVKNTITSGKSVKAGKSSDTDNNSTHSKDTSHHTTKETDSTSVYVTETGSKYHKHNHCGSTNPDKTVKMTESEALSKGYDKCSKCW